MFTFHSTQFNTKGFIMVLSASLLSGLRWTLAQLVTQKNKLGTKRNQTCHNAIQCSTMGKEETNGYERHYRDKSSLTYLYVFFSRRFGLISTKIKLL